MNLRFFCAALLLTLTVPALAQQGNIRSITRHRVEPGKMGDLRAAIKDYNAELKKAGGERYYSIWSSLSGPMEIVRVDYYKSYAELERTPDPKLAQSAGARAAISSRILQSFSTGDRVIDEILPNQSLPMSAEPPKMVQVLRTVVKPDKAAEYNAIIEAELVPAIKKSGIKVYLRSRTRFGGPAGEYRSAIGLDSWSALDGTSPVVQAMGGQAAYDRFIAKIRPLIIESEYNVYRFEPELSYMAPAAGSTSSGNR